MNNTSCAREPGRGIVGASLATQALVKSIRRVAPFNSTVLISGPSGTGKELVAREIHLSSPRSKQLFIPVDCASMTGELMTSQLCGHVKGAFTSADQGSLGCFRAADGGTLFLDEIGELPLSLQARLLRVIQERSVVPVGGHTPLPVDVRIVAATNRDLRGEVLAGRFREDLYYRLRVVAIETLPLYKRSNDIEALVPAFLDELCQAGHPHHTVSAGAMQLLQAYRWPGNVRELKNVLEQASIETDAVVIAEAIVERVLAASARIQLHNPSSPSGYEVRESWACETRPDALSEPGGNDFCTTGNEWPTLAENERKLIVATLQRTYYNKSAAARLLDISRQALLRKLTRFDITSPDMG